jgi:protoheme ferro-lyase
MTLSRAATVNDHPAFIRMLADVVRRHASGRHDGGV